MHRLTLSVFFLSVFFLSFVSPVLSPVCGQAQETPAGAAIPDPAAPLLRPIPQDPEAYGRLVKRAKALVKQLGADTFAKREAATKELRDIGCRSTEVLKDALDLVFHLGDEGALGLDLLTSNAVRGVPD